MSGYPVGRISLKELPAYWALTFAIKLKKGAKIMKRLTLIALLLTLCATGAAAQTQSPSVPGEDADPLSIARKNWIHYVDEPFKHFRTARQFFAQKDFSSSAYALRQAMLYIIVESLRTSDNKEILLHAINQLDRLSEQLENGDIVSADQYNSVLTHVNYLLSDYYYAQGVKYWKNQRIIRTGYALQASVNHLERAASLLDYEFNEDAKSTIKESRSLSKKLIDDNLQLKQEEVKPKMNALERVLMDFKIKNEDEFRIERRF
jgi:hypothetical protein